MSVWSPTRRNGVKARVTAALFTVGLGLVVFGAQAAPVQGQTQTASPGQVALFESKVRPVFETTCVGCHGPRLQSGDLRLDRPITAVQAKLLAEAVSYETDLKMPPSGKLPADQVAALTAWAKAGAPWPAAAPAKPKGKWWAFVAPRRPPLPEVKDKAWAKGPLDLFVLAGLEAEGLRPAPPADRRTLVRRATFDLTGLPPTAREVEDFVNDKGPGAFEKVVDRLLASPAYGERWGRHWLDVARYADSNGLDENLVFPNAWRYRDWVVGAFNADMPVDRFIQEQLAGDILPGAGDDGMVATGFLALGGKTLAEDDPVKQEMDIIDEQVDVVSKAFLGLTVGCARCHDHKFDPVPTKDYYAMAGIFKSTKTMENFKVVAEWNERPMGTPGQKAKLAAVQKALVAKKKEADDLRKEAGDKLLAELKPKTAAYEAAARELLAADAARPVLHPVVATPDGAAPKDAVVSEAEDFVRGNVGKDTTGYGKGVGVVYNVGTFPNQAEYSVTVPTAGPYQLDVRYASGDPRPVRVLVNGGLALSSAAGQVTGGFYPAQQRWSAEGVVVLRAGSNTVQFERDSYFPHIDKFLLVPRPGAAPTESLGAVAARHQLLPDVLRAVADQVKAKAPVSIGLPENPDRLLPKPVADRLKRLGDEMAALAKEKPDLPLAMAVEEGTPTDLRVSVRGNYLTLGEPAPRRFPTCVSGPGLPAIPSGHSGRLELARWITSPQNALTARVFVNRVWRWRFGRGIVGSVDNFGMLGEQPSNPALLDWLATTFVDDDHWSLKKLQRRMMLSATYQMSGGYSEPAAKADGDNRLLWRFPRRRLEAEEIRDSIMAVSGLLDRTMGGTMLNLKPRSYVTDTNSADSIKYDSPRRAIYLPVVRAAVYDVYQAFDFGDPTVMNGDRPSTTIAPQALFMLNGPIVTKAAQSLASHALSEKDATDAQRVRSLYLTCYGRPATDWEVSNAQLYLARFQAAYTLAPDPRHSAWQSLCKALLAANEFIYVE
ncbi:MAG: DUF1549 domain-containing protein [Fimbriimonadaceae bacterium]|nr:DUF1549 domain-containing protein [Fimbriimonadaceae bacterium]